MQPRLLITGANRGIGLALVKHYLDDGWHVDASCRDISQAQELLSLATVSPQNLHLHTLDVTDHDAVMALSQTLKGTPLDLLINNAGYYGPKGYGFGHTNANEWRKVFEVNTIAPLKMAEAFYPQLKLAPQGIIASISSKVGSMTENTSGGGYIYRSSKAALNSVVKSLSNDLLPQGILSVALHPGWVQTEMGGPNALIDTQVSVSGLKNVLDNLSPSQSGEFYNFDGTNIPW